MSGYKHIETLIARYISGRYHSVLEIGTGHNTHAAELIQRSGILITCSDLSIPQGVLLVPYVIFDVCSPDKEYISVDCIFAIRPTEEMMSSLVMYAQRCNADLLVYHLGFEGYSHPHKIINCGVCLCQYVTHQN